MELRNCLKYLNYFAQPAKRQPNVQFETLAPRDRWLRPLDGGNLTITFWSRLSATHFLPGLQSESLRPIMASDSSICSNAFFFRN
jgi:hypothetical protein